jgi:small basic protein (TIGR04137 family)
MSMDRSLKSSSALARHRNVLTRAERIEKLQDEDCWNEGDSVFGLQKVAHRKVASGAHKDKKEKAGEEGEAVAEPIAGETQSES